MKEQKGFSKQGFMNTLGATLESICRGKCEIILSYDSKLTQQHGLFHGGVIAAIADNSAGFAAYSLMEENYQPLSIEFKINFLSTAKGEKLKAKAEVLNAGKRIFHVRSDVFLLNDDQEQLVASALATIKATRTVSEL